MDYVALPQLLLYQLAGGLGLKFPGFTVKCHVGEFLFVRYYRYAYVKRVCLSVLSERS